MNCVMRKAVSQVRVLAILCCDWPSLSTPHFIIPMERGRFHLSPGPGRGAVLGRSVSTNSRSSSEALREAVAQLLIGGRVQGASAFKKLQVS